MAKHNINPTRKLYDMDIAYLHDPPQKIQSINDFFNLSQN